MNDNATRIPDSPDVASAVRPAIDVVSDCDEPDIVINRELLEAIRVVTGIAEDEEKNDYERLEDAQARAAHPFTAVLTIQAWLGTLPASLFASVVDVNPATKAERPSWADDPSWHRELAAREDGFDGMRF